MIGQNELYLNDAEMKAAVEYYLNNVVMKIPVSVKSVERTHNIGTQSFRVILDEPKVELVATGMTFK